MVRADFASEGEGRQHTVTVTAKSLSRAEELAEEAMDQPVKLVCPLNSSFFAGDGPEEVNIQE